MIIYNMNIMHKWIIIYLLMACLSAASIQAYQAKLWDGQLNQKSSANNPKLFFISYPTSYDIITYQRSIVFAGFRMGVGDHVAFSVLFSILDPTGDTIQFNILQDVKMVCVSFHVILTDKTSSWIWAETSSHTMTSINTSGGSSSEQYTHSLSRTLSNVGDMGVQAFFKDFRIEATGGGWDPQITLSKNGLSVSTIQIKADRGYSQKKIYQMSVILILYNKTHADSSPAINYNSYIQSLSQSTNFMTSTTNDFIPSITIDSRYNKAGDAFNHLCFLGIWYFFLRTNTQQAFFWYDISTSPITENSRLSRSGKSNKIELDYALFCVKEKICNASYGYLKCIECDSGGCFQCQAGYNLTNVNSTDICVITDCLPLSYHECAACYTDGCVSCQVDFYQYNTANTTICVTNLCFTYFNLTNCQQCKHNDCINCIDNFYTKMLNGSVVCATTDCLTLVNISNCLECFSEGCLSCNTSYYEKEANGRVQCATQTGCNTTYDFYNCLECTAEECLQCEANFYIITVNSNLMCATNRCDTLLNHNYCQECIEQQCLTCKPNFYFKTVNGSKVCVTNQCQTMFNYRNCAQCTVQICFSCNMNFYNKVVNGWPLCVTSQCSFIFGINNCQECSAYGCIQCMTDFFDIQVAGNHYCATNQCLIHFGLGNCGLCTIDGCLQCDTNFTLGVINYQITCLAEQCETMFGMVGCNRCTETKCYNCGSGFYIEGGKCFCIEGTMIDGMCTTIDGCVTPVKDLAGDIVCSVCNQTYFKEVDGLCVCKQGQLVNGICNTIFGCMVPMQDSQKGIICRYCNLTANFNSTPTQEGSCQCKQHYQLTGSACIQICGDGALLSMDTTSCDDGNRVDFDGCSSSCQIEPMFRCTNYYKGKSQCLYIGVPLNMSLNYAEREEGDTNRAVLVFQLVPDLFILKNMDFNSQTQLICDVDGISMVSADYSSGKLTVKADFTEDIEAVSCSVNITYDPTLIDTENSYLIFNVTSRSGKLVYITVDNLTIKKNISFIFKILSYLLLGAAVISLRHKMISLELIVMAQVVYFSYGLSSNPSYLGGAIKKLIWVSGYRQFFYQSSYDGTFREEYEICWQFVESNIVWLTLMATVMVMTLIIKIAMNFRKQKHKQKEQTTNDIEQIAYTFSRPINYPYTCLIFPLVGLNIIMLFLTSYIDLSSHQQVYTLANRVNSLIMTTAWLMTGIVVGIQVVGLGQKGGQQRIGGVNQMKEGYISFFLIQVILFSMLVQTYLYLQSSNLIWSIIVILFIYCLMILVYRPYRSIFSNICLLCQESAMIYSVSLSLINNYTQISFDQQTNMLFLLQALIALSIVLALARTCRYYWELIQLDCKGYQRGNNHLKIKAKKIDQNNQIEVSLFNSMNPYKSLLHPNVFKVEESRYRQTDHKNADSPEQEKHKIEEEQEINQDEELVRIKKRLKKDLINHKQRIKQEQEDAYK